MQESRCCSEEGAESGGPKELCISWRRQPLTGMSKFGKVVRPIKKHWESLLQCMQQKRAFHRQ